MSLKPCSPYEMNPPISPLLVVNEDGLHSVHKFLAGVTVACIDLETNVVPTFTGRKIRTIQVGNRDQQFVIDLLAFAGSPAALYDGQGGYSPDNWAQPVIEVLRPFLETDAVEKVGHNLNFEYITLKYCLGMRMWNLHCTQEVEKVLYTGKVRFDDKNFWTLEHLTGRYLGLQINKEHQKGFDLCSPLTTEQVLYCALDARLPIGIRQGQLAKLAKNGLSWAAYIENAAIPAFGDMHLNGMLIDRDKWLEQDQKTKEEHQKNIERLDVLSIPKVGLNKAPFTDEQLKAREKLWRDSQPGEHRKRARESFMEAQKACTAYRKASAKYQGKAAINYAAPIQIDELLQKFGYKLESTKDEFLENFEGDQIIDAVRAFRKTEKRLKNYGKSFLDDYVDAATGRIHSNIKQLGAETGRSASSNPNLQNIPKGDEYRHCFVARPGYTLVVIDYSGQELRILADISGEQVMIDAFNAGKDVHSVGAELIFGDQWLQAAEDGCAYYAKGKKCKCKGHKELREQIKAINFGIVYGMAANKLARTLGISKKEAQALLNKWLKTFPKAAEWLEKQGKFGREHLYSRTMSGRIRYYKEPEWNYAKKLAMEQAEEDGREFHPDDTKKKFNSLYASIERESKNSPIQGTGAEMAKLAMGAGFDKEGLGFMWHELEPRFGARLLSFVHDEVIIEAKIGTEQDVLKYAGDCMVRSGAEFVKSVEMEWEGGCEVYWKKG